MGGFDDGGNRKLGDVHLLRFPVIHQAEVANLLQTMRRGEAHYLIIGPKAYGTNKWVITKLSNSLQRYDRGGNLLAASVNVTMQSYSSR